MSPRLIALVATVAIAGLLLWATGVLDGLQDVDAIRARVDAAGAWGPALYIAVAIAGYAVFVLSFPVWASVALWPLPLAFAYSFAAALLGSLLTYGLTFLLGRRWARERVPQSLAAWEARLEARPVVALVTLRFLLWANPLVDMLLAVSRVPPRAYLIGTVVGLVWPTAFQIALGAGGGIVLTMLADAGWTWWHAAVAAAIAIAAVLPLRRTATRRG